MFYARGNPFACALLFLILLWPLGLILIGFSLAIRDWRRENAKHNRVHLVDSNSGSTGKS